MMATVVVALMIHSARIKIFFSSNYTNGVKIDVAQKAWIPFIIQLPPQTITPVQVYPNCVIPIEIIVYT